MEAWLRDIPEQIMTDRLIIRPHRSGDGAELCAATIDSLVELRQWPASMGWALDDPSPSNSEEFCCACAKSFAERRDFPLLLFHRGTGQVVGSSGLHRPDWSVPKMEIGWWGRSTYAQQRLVTEAVRAILAYGFQNLRARRVFALPDNEKLASCRICERVGMAMEGLLLNERAEPSGRLRHTRVYAAIR
jgi:RimJ/RimL family protein N-acetyltransferase